MDIEGKAPIIVMGIVISFILLISGTIVLCSVPNPPQSPQITPWPTLKVTPGQPIKNQSNDDFEGHTATNDTVNTTINNTTPIPTAIVNLTGENLVDYNRLAEMYPWVKYGYNNSSPYIWMHDPETFSREMNGQGNAERIYMYQNEIAHQIVKAPSLNLEILHNDDKTPYDFNREAIILGHDYDGYFRFTNTGDKPFQGNVAVAINASLFFAGTMVHLENKIITDVYLSLAPGQSNDFYRKWKIDNFNGAPIPTGALNIVIEIRDLSNGATIGGLTIKPIVARDPNNDGVLTF